MQVNEASGAEGTHHAAPKDSEGEPKSHVITPRALLLGALTIAAMFYYIVQVGQRLRSGWYVHSQFPMAAFTPFVLWLFANACLMKLWPRRALRQGELLTIFSMVWVVGVIPQLGWINYWTAIMATPTYFATAENQWSDLFFRYMPWHVFADTSPGVIDTFWFGLPEGASLPWEGWIGPIVQWLGVSMAMVVFGLCLIIVFQKQWVEGEKLTFPLAQMPLDLTSGFDGSRQLPAIFRNGIFWLGFATVFLPMLYNMGTYFAPGLPPVELYWKHYELEPGGPFPSVTFRVMPLVLAVTYLCPVDILGSMVVFYTLVVLKMGAMRTVGFSVGSAGQQIADWDILYMESYGALVFVALWSVWLARRHLRQVWRHVRYGEGERAEVVRYRLAVAGMVVSGASVVGWAISLGMSLFLALLTFLLMTLVYFVTTKLIAATGFAYLFPNRPQLKGESFVVDLIGSIYLTERNLVAFKVFTSYAFFGNFRIPVWPALIHHLRIFSLRKQPGWVVAAVLVAFPVGWLVAARETIVLAYDGGAALFLRGTDPFDQLAHLMQNHRVPDLGKWGIWVFGLTEAALLAWLRTHFSWFSLHPIGLAFQYTFGTRLYWFSLLLVWVVKLTLLRYGGVRAYHAGKPFFYGLGIGYVIGVTLSGVVDLVWFPSQGHHVHGW